MKLLIVIDMQNDFIDGALGTPQAAAIVEPVLRRIELYASEGHKVIFTQDTHTPDYPDTQEGRLLPITHCQHGTDGWQIHPMLRPYATDVLTKPSFGSLALADKVKHLSLLPTEIELIGLCTDVCVISNALILKAALPETPIKVTPSCCAGTTPENHETALAAMRNCQVMVG